MNLLTDFQKKVEKLLQELEKKEILVLPKSLKSLKVELSPKSQKGDLACNAAMILSKINNKSSLDLASLLKDSLLKNIIEIYSIDIAKPGFLNITLRNDFWREHLLNITSFIKSQEIPCLYL